MQPKRAAVHPFFYISALFGSSGCIMLMPEEATSDAGFSKEQEL
jgi:hypothetical protein